MVAGLGRTWSQGTLSSMMGVARENGLTFVNDPMEILLSLKACVPSFLEAKWHSSPSQWKGLQVEEKLCAVPRTRIRWS